MHQVLFSLAIILLACRALKAQPISESTPEDYSVPANVVTPLIKPIPPDRKSGIEPGQTGVDWAGLFKASGRFLAVEHAFRCATEYDTRNAKGSFFGGYGSAISNLHGFADGDPFYVNYVGHPMQGATSGFIWIHNDRRYRGVEFGRNPLYWKSRFRATAFAWAYSVQFEIGPISEASIGYIQAYYPQQGFVDHVVTPVVGTGWIIAEDVVDKYFVKWAESKTTNRFARMFIRGGLNPSRSMSNMLNAKAPWHRDTRPGVLTYRPETFRPASDPVRTESSKQDVRSIAPFELTTAAEARNYLNASGVGCAGGGATATYRMAPYWQLVAELSGCKFVGLRENFSGDSLVYMTGTRWTPFPEGRWSPHLQLLFGGNKITNEEMFPDKKRALEAALQQKGIAPNPQSDHEKYTRQDDANGFAMAAGGGLDLKLTNALAVQVAKLEYNRAWLRPMNGVDYSSGLRFTTGIVLRMGTW